MLDRNGSKMLIYSPTSAIGASLSETTNEAPGPIIIKKYANRRLYNTQTSSYVTLDHLCDMVKRGVEFEVRDARTGDDITRSVLAQIIFEEEGKGQHLLPIQFLRQLIRFYGDSLQSFVPSYLEMSMESFSKNQESMRDQFANAFGAAPGFKEMERLGRQNLAMFERAMKMFTPFGGATRGAAEGETQTRPNGATGAEPQSAARDEEMRALKDQLTAMQQQIADLATRK